VLLFAETPLERGLLEAAKRAGRRIVCVPMQEWLPEDLAGWPSLVDLFICPTYHCYRQFCYRLRCEHFAWPVDVEAFRFVCRETVRRFLFVDGHGGWRGRKGGAIVREAFGGSNLPLTVRTQRPRDWRGMVGVKVLGPVEDQADLYARGSVLIAPHAADGIGLELLEAMASGLPVIATDGDPWRELPLLDRIPAGRYRQRIKREVDWYQPRPRALASVCRRWLGRSIAEASANARHCAVERAWKLLAPRFARSVRGEQ